MRDTSLAPSPAPLDVRALHERMGRVYHQPVPMRSFTNKRFRYPEMTWLLALLLGLAAPAGPVAGADPAFSLPREGEGAKGSGDSLVAGAGELSIRARSPGSARPPSGGTSRRA